MWTGGGHWPRKGVWGCAALKTPFSASPAARKGPISSKRVSSQDPLLRKFWNFSLYNLNFHPNFSSQAPKFGNFFSSQAPKFWKFSTHKPPFSEATVSSQAPHFGNPGCTPLPEKSWVPPPPRDVVIGYIMYFLTSPCIFSTETCVFIRILWWTYIPSHSISFKARYGTCHSPISDIPKTKNSTYTGPLCVYVVLYVASYRPLRKEH